MKSIPGRKTLGAKQILNDLKSGLTRWKRDDLGFGSLEEKYELTFTEMKTVIADHRIKGVKTAIPTILIVDDLDDMIIDQHNQPGKVFNFTDFTVDEDRKNIGEVTHNEKDLKLEVSQGEKEEYLREIELLEDGNDDAIYEEALEKLESKEKKKKTRKSTKKPKSETPTETVVEREDLQLSF